METARFVLIADSRLLLPVYTFSVLSRRLLPVCVGDRGLVTVLHKRPTSESDG